MGLISFVKEAGEKLLGRGRKAEASVGPPSKPTAPIGTAFIDSDALADRVNDLGLKAENLTLSIEGDIVIVTGEAATQADYEKIVLALGNTEGVAGVDNRMTVKVSAPPAVYYTVAKGDTLSKIAKTQYGDPNKYNAIFEANRPMLKHPDRIYPGQVLRVPPLAAKAG
jgi:nucleoid-associated protein YgaU